MQTTKQNNAEGLNKYQARTYNNVLEHVLRHGIYEVKDMEVTYFEDSDVMVYVRVGMPNDEGTLAECICRDSYLFHIGRKGGLYTFSDNCNRCYRKAYEVRSLRI